MSRKTIVPLAVLLSGRQVFAVRGAEGEGEELEEESTEGTSEKDEGESEKDDAAKDSSRKKDPEIARLKSESAERRIAANNLLKERDELAEKLRQADLKDKSELEKLQSDFAAMQAKLEKQQAALKDTTIEREALRLSPKLKLAWRDLDDVLGFLGRAEGVTVGDDGVVEGVEKVLKDLAKAKPHWLDAKETNTGSGGAGPSGGNIGGGSGGDGKGGRGGDRTALEKKYVALRNR